MAPTLVSSPLVHDTAPPTSPSFQMPNVFVIPPAEDESPAWCCFDATEAPFLATDPDIPFLDHALSAFQAESQLPVLHRDTGPFTSDNPVIMPRKSGGTRSIMDVLMNDDYPESDDEMDLHLDHDVFASDRGPGNDSEVVEVIKVRRHTDDIEERTSAPMPHTKPSSSFKSRASKAFASLRNVGKGSLRSKPKAQDIITSRPVGEREPRPRSQTPTVSGRGSILSQLFSPPPTLQSRSSVSSFDAARASSESQSPPSTGKYFSSPYNQSPSDRRHGPLLPSSSSLNLEHQDIRSPSPTPSTQTRSNRRRFSMMNLQRIFSFSQADEFSDITPSSMSRASSGPSTSSSSGANTPTEESTPRLNSEDHGLLTEKSNFPAVPAPGPGEISFEMRLDSLHFEALSFDADRF
ncbi:hypothetical protein LshimejAT787_0208410 [Lyophyllum shimeji]|uniref:Uncharacterized protein n=1 Tax=Lyophyllum shimeji TaxID=47721 RepID=A0A9P3ULD1_LYOSH|nr:hypothetical protein LshimejAT787_0208410 [Lyophyllum shimeji]